MRLINYIHCHSIPLFSPVIYILLVVARGRMSTYFPSPPESTTPPIVQEEEEIEEGEKPTETQEEAESKQPVEEEEPLELACVEPVTMMELDSVESTPTEPVYEWPSKSHKEEV